MKAIQWLRMRLASASRRPSKGAPRIRLCALALFCGAFDLGQMQAVGLNGFLVSILLCSCLGKKDFWSAPAWALMQAEHHTPRAMPSLFIAVGDGDPLNR